MKSALTYSLVFFITFTRATLSNADPLVCTQNQASPIQEISLLSHSLPNDEEVFTTQDQKYCKPAHAASSPKDAHQLPNNGTVWRVGSNRWTDQLEKDYGEFVSNEIDRNFFKRYQIPSDCADAAVTIRLIFARIHHLPFQVETASGTLGFNTRKFSHFSTVKDWDPSNWKSALAKDLRFRAYLNEVQNKVSTSSLDRNTYPIQISECKMPGQAKKLSHWVLPGTVLLDALHARFISKIDSTDRVEPIQEMSSTVPREIRALHESAIEFEYGSSSKYGKGVLRFNWAVNCGGVFRQVSDEKMPGYSKEQYDYGNDQANVLTKLSPGKRGPPDNAYVDRKLKEIKIRLVERLNLINEAQKKLKRDPKAFEDLVEYENYSTPNLDAVLYASLAKLSGSDGENDRPQSVTDYGRAKMKASIIALGGGKYMSIFDFFGATDNYNVVSDPTASSLDRWGWKYLVGQMKNEVNWVEDDRHQLKTAIDLLNPVDLLKYKLGYLKLPEEQNLEKHMDRIKTLQKKGVALPKGFR